MYGYGYRYNSGLVVGSGGGGGGFVNNYSLDFDGVDDYIDLGDAFTSLTSFSISAWFKSDDTASSNQSIVSSRIGSIGVSQGIDVFINSNQLYGRIYDNGATQVITSFTDTSSWHQVLITYNGTNLEMYLDGVSQGTSIGSYTNSSADWLIGKWNNGAFYFNGKIDEVSIFDFAISVSDVWDGSGAATDLSLLATPPTNWYRMGDNGSWKSPQWLIPNNENKDKVSNYSMDFDGVNDRVSLASSINLGINSTISLWVNLESGFLGVLLGENSYSNDYLMYAQENIAFYIRIAGVALNYTNMYNQGIGGIASGVWNNIVIQRTGDSIEAFLNGVSKGTNTGFGTVTDTMFDTIGGKPSGFVTCAQFDEVAAWNNNTVNPLDIYNGGTPTTITGAVAHYKMGEEATFSGGVWTVPDAVGSNNGTSANMTIEDRIGEAPNSENNAVSFNMDFVDVVPDVP